MFEYDEELVAKTLASGKYNLSELDISKIAHVPMHQYRIATSNKPLLYVENLQVCIGIYAMFKGFGFAAHINPVVMREDDFYLMDGKAVGCKRINDMRDAILSHRPEIS
ncbi:MAG: hypothetical protein K2J20_02710 [Bacilli bacterium]|nr:hypothetical protein [Bacilli bacterium]